MRSNTDSCTSTQTDPDEGQAPGPSWARSRLATWLLKSGYDGTVWASRDGAVTWTALYDAPELVEIEWRQSGLIVGMDDTGTVWTTAGLTSIWQQAATGPAEVETMYVPPARP
jgi:hypothetical protein